ncbi:hypothetical protein BDQ17DRAFT_750998 [Cyathus striatus]|nr:hypothetical protein BDQ17DRAFT_750998 [Cyathus striatus]
MSSPATQTTIVTGAAQGIGRAIAIRLANDGYNVVVSDLASQSSLMDEVVAEICAKSQKAIAVPADVSQEAAVNALVQKAVVEFGGIDLMVANAGIAVLTPILETTIEEWDKVFMTNVKGTLLYGGQSAHLMCTANIFGPAQTLFDASANISDVVRRTFLVPAQTFL